MISRLCSMSRTAASCWPCCHRTSARWYMLLDVSLHMWACVWSKGEQCEGSSRLHGGSNHALIALLVGDSLHRRHGGSSRSSSGSSSPCAPVPRAQHLQLHLQRLLVALGRLLQLALQEAGEVAYVSGSSCVCAPPQSDQGKHEAPHEEPLIKSHTHRLLPGETGTARPWCTTMQQ